MKFFVILKAFCTKRACEVDRLNTVPNCTQVFMYAVWKDTLSYFPLSLWNWAVSVRGQCSLHRPAHSPDDLLTLPAIPGAHQVALLRSCDFPSERGWPSVGRSGLLSVLSCLTDASHAQLYINHQPP